MASQIAFIAEDMAVGLKKSAPTVEDRGGYVATAAAVRAISEVNARPVTTQDR